MMQDNLERNNYCQWNANEAATWFKECGLCVGAPSSLTRWIVPVFERQRWHGYTKRLPTSIRREISHRRFPHTQVYISYTQTSYPLICTHPNLHGQLYPHKNNDSWVINHFWWLWHWSHHGIVCHFMKIQISDINISTVCELPPRHVLHYWGWAACSLKYVMGDSHWQGEFLQQRDERCLHSLSVLREGLYTSTWFNKPETNAILSIHITYGKQTSPRACISYKSTSMVFTIAVKTTEGWMGGLIDTCKSLLSPLLCCCFHCYSGTQNSKTFYVKSTVLH